MRPQLAQPWVARVGAIYCSTERNAIEGAPVPGQHLCLPFTQVAVLGENDRSAYWLVASRRVRGMS
jgi:hypothetical protein